MPELPDVELYVAKLRELLVGQRLVKVRVYTVSLLRTFSPTTKELEGLAACGVRRMGKRIVLDFEQNLHVVIHLMISGRFLWDQKEPVLRSPNKIFHAGFQFENGTLWLTEASPKKRASLHIVEGEEAVRALDPGGVDVSSLTVADFGDRLRAENRTLKRALTNPHKFSGIGNAYSDEIFHAARISPIKLTSALSDEEISRLLEACRSVLALWTERLQEQFKDKFPGKGQVTAFRPDFAVHGKFGKPCPVCGKPVQRIVYSDNESNYCAVCQTEGRVLADRALSRLLGEDWPRTLEEE